MFTRVTPIICALSLLSHEVNAQSGPMNHRQAAATLVDALERAEELLSNCVDATSTKDAIAQLEKIKEEILLITQAQQNFAEPTMQDFLSAERYMEAFKRAQDGISAQIRRLHQQGLYTDELRDLLKVAP